MAYYIYVNIKTLCHPSSPSLLSLRLDQEDDFRGLRCVGKNHQELEFLSVINAYIYCMLAHDHLQDRAGEKVHIISTFVSGQIKEEGERDIDPSKYRRIVRHVNTYLQQDMLFIPINMPGYHWYLAVANAKKREIQVLDSLGENVKRNDLATTLRGLEKWLKLA
ncbi:uncharacterized protein [Triticum aestivum]|uniref:uncharacterized protein n=1 Tax=Triticum aestivum TaxID=4565 RepID=UPI001D0186A4|nr:uncharacterized protein LOC123072129 [Triticum aestivum]